MPRYFIEVGYKGTAYAGFQVQQNANTIQAEVEKALAVFYRHSFSLTGSSRTDAGVHARHNFFHFDDELGESSRFARDVYRLNAILPADIVVQGIREVLPGAHCRFDALWRQYQYTVYSRKDPFMQDRGYYYPYKLNRDILEAAAKMVVGEHDFTSFAKRNTQVNNFRCTVLDAGWTEQDGRLYFNIRANRFLRGMVRGLAGTMLRVGRGNGDENLFRRIMDAHDPHLADFSTPPQGLTLVEVRF